MAIIDGTPDDDVEAIEQTARALLDDRMSVIRSLASTKKRRKEIQDALAEVDREYGKEFVAAQRAGWTEDELGRLGFEEPTRRPAGRPPRGGARRRGAASKPKASPNPAVVTPPADAAAAGSGAVVGAGGEENSS